MQDKERETERRREIKIIRETNATYAKQPPSHLGMINLPPDKARHEPLTQHTNSAINIPASLFTQIQNKQQIRISIFYGGWREIFIAHCLPLGISTKKKKKKKDK